MSFVPLKRVLPQAIRQAGLEASVSAARVVDEAERALVRLWGPEKAGFVHAVSFKEGTLQVSTAAPSASHALRGFETAWMNEINRAFGERRVQQIRVRHEGF